MSSSLYSPLRYFDGQTSQEHEAHISVQLDRLSITYADKTWVGKPIHVSQLSPEYSEFSIPDVPGYFVSNQSTFYEWAKQAEKGLITGRQQMKIAKSAFAIGLVLVVLMATLVFNPRLTPILTQKIPTSFDERLGRMLLNQIRANSTEITDPEQVAAVTDTLAALSKGRKHSNFTYEVLYLDEDINNAISLPGGKIVIYRGLVEAMRDSSELLGVMAHELAHIDERHGMSMLIRASVVGVVTQLFLGDMTGLFAALSQGAPVLFNAVYSQDLEREADDLAVQILNQNGYSKYGLEKFMKRRLKEQERAASESDDTGIVFAEKWGQFLSTHPGMDERYQTIQGLSEAKGLKNRPYNKRRWEKVFKN